MGKYKDYLNDQREKSLKTLEEIIGASDNALVIGLDRPLTKFYNVIAFYLSPDITARREQVIEWGIQPSRTIQLDFNGSQLDASFSIVTGLSGDPFAIKQLASNLSRYVKKLE